MGINTCIEGCNTIQVGWFITVHIPLLIPRMNTDIRTTLLDALYRKHSLESHKLYMKMFQIKEMRLKSQHFP